MITILTETKFLILGVQISTLEYKGEEIEKLADEDVKTLSKALLNNNVFSSSLDLSENTLTDLVRN